MSKLAPAGRGAPSRSSGRPLQPVHQGRCPARSGADLREFAGLLTRPAELHAKDVRVAKHDLQKVIQVMRKALHD